jgi:hypothetical protein
MPGALLGTMPLGPKPLLLKPLLPKPLLPNPLLGVAGPALGLPRGITRSLSFKEPHPLGPGPSFFIMPLGYMIRFLCARFCDKTYIKNARMRDKAKIFTCKAHIQLIGETNEFTSIWKASERQAIRLNGCGCAAPSPRLLPGTPLPGARHCVDHQPVPCCRSTARSAFE